MMYLGERWRDRFELPVRIAKKYRKTPHWIEPIDKPCTSSFAATPALQTFLACDEKSLAVVNQPGLKERISSALDNGKITLSGGTKTEMGQRWVFDTCMTALVFG